ncbi:AraC family transcriptional regulator [Shewanella schlegeliana]|uniref:AraC family transcriptional regulator n=1 Tax=Shewanella schlegeliana TaxID=190308 RepID=A0ABS1T2U9_9GAMM|nr:AraC family transcriptional regulator [Shewanella schlegeliana]MBL4914132.1 AraC family transcriptional regulator [Shewanella schlegeliana]MCL1110831.1 AraC family transcriptional regulator [Shewanella schlegeliana]GIU36343.1 transcriptional regulator [Shewanella schlegeliana]
MSSANIDPANLSSTSYTTIAAWSLAIARALSVSKIDPKALFEQVGLDLDALQAQPGERVEIDKMTRLWQAAEQASASDAFGLTVGQYAFPMHFHSLGKLLMSSDSLAQAFEALPDYSALVSNSGQIRLQRTPQWLGFTISPLKGVEISELAIDAFFSSLMQQGKQMVGHRHFVRRVELMRSAPKSNQAWQDCFGCPVVMNATDNCMWMDRSVLERTALTKNPQLAESNELAVRQYLLDMQALSWRQKTSQGIHAALLNQEPTAAKIAQMYNISERSLGRYLQHEGTGFRELLKLKRQELALHYLINTDMPISLLSDTLGYSNLSNFTRSFRSWQGCSPSLYREKHREQFCS